MVAPVPVADGTNTGIRLYRNLDGKGQFGVPVLIWANEPVQRVFAIDVDQDGDEDLVPTWRRRNLGWVEEYPGDFVWFVWYENDGTAGLTRRVIEQGLGWLGHVTAADLDGDTDLDLVTVFRDGDRLSWFENLMPHPGDANRDGRFDSVDFVQVFQAGEYEDGIPGNSTWEEGDWNGDGDFDSADFVLAFQTGLYEVKSQAVDNPLAAAVDWLFAQDQRSEAPTCVRGVTWFVPSKDRLRHGSRKPGGSSFPGSK